MPGSFDIFKGSGIVFLGVNAFYILKKNQLSRHAAVMSPTNGRSVSQKRFVYTVLTSQTQDGVLRLMGCVDTSL